LPPGDFAARFLAAVIRPPLLFFAMGLASVPGSHAANRRKWSDRCRTVDATQHRGTRRARSMG
jgi:hypothetical protein